MQANQIAMFTLHYRSVPVTFTPSDPQALASAFPALAAAIDTALAAGWTAGAEGGSGDGKARKTVTVNGWVLGESANKGIRVIWLYSDQYPYLERKVTQVYAERIKELPITVPDELQPLTGGVAPEKGKAIAKGWLKPCQPFDIELVDTGETYLDHPVFEFSRVISKPATAPAAQPAPQPAQAANGSAGGSGAARGSSPTSSPTDSPSGGQAGGPVLSEKARALIEYERLGLDLYPTKWPTMSGERVSELTGGASTDPQALTLEQINSLIGRLKTVKANKGKVNPPPTGK